jgi:hypothetical protein
MVAGETAGNPMNDDKWVRSSLRELSRQLRAAGHVMSAPTVGRLLRALDYSPKANLKRREGGESHPDREAQFVHIAEQRQLFEASGWPILSVDTKKKELIGDFKNAGRCWCREAPAVNVHDFRGDAAARAVPYGIYDLTNRRGHMYVGLSADTPEFAVTAIARWWEETGRATYPTADRLLILADAGGSNGCRPHAWKEQLQSALSDRCGLMVTVCHYPTGCSKWNPIEHSLFSHISMNWAGVPLQSVDRMLALLRGTHNQSGLTVSASLIEETFEAGKKVARSVMKQLALTPHSVCPNWNYTIRPRLADRPRLAEAVGT